MATYVSNTGTTTLSFVTGFGFSNTVFNVNSGSSVLVAGDIDFNGVADALILDADADTTISAPTDDQIDIEIAGADDFTITANKFNVLSGSQVTFATASSAAAANAVLMGGGTLANPLASSTAGAKFMEFYARCSATTGTSDGLYMEQELTGAAGSGGAIKATVLMSAAATDAYGVYGRAETTSTTGYASSSVAAVRGTLSVANAAVPASGYYFGALAEITSAGSSSSLASSTEHAILGVYATGDSTGKAAVKNAIAFLGTSSANVTNMISSVSLAELPANTVGVRVLVNGTAYRMPLVLETEWN